PGRALAYYASRGETPLVWGGAGAERLGLVGRVTEAQYRAIYGPGGACDPTTSERLVAALRPGMELVIAAHKSVAELGVIGRAEAARVAVELGYAIAPDHGPSSRLGHWRIVGIPDEVLEIHSKRAAEISEAVEARGYSSYRARNIAARDTREVKRHTPVGELMPRWHQELAEVGWTVPELVASVERAGREAVLEPGLSEREITRLMGETLSPEGRLSVAKVFTAADVVVTVGPALYGRPVGALDRLVQRIPAVPDCVPP